MPFNHPSASSQQPAASSQHFSPRHIITAGVLFALSCIIFSTYLATQTHWLGVSFIPHEDGLLVSHVSAKGPLNEKLTIGNVVTAIAGADGNRYDLRALDIMEDPYDLQLYREFTDFFDRQSAIYKRLTQTSTLIFLNDGKEIILQAADHRPLSSVPFLFWFQLCCGFISLLIGVGVYAFRQEEIAPRCFALSSIGLMAIITAAAMYSTRELAIDGSLFYRLTLLHHSGTVLFVCLGTAVLWYSPLLLSPLPTAGILLGL